MPRRRKVHAGADGWTHIKSGPEARYIGGDPKPGQPTRSYEATLAIYKEWRGRLLKSEGWENVKTFAQTILMPEVVNSPRGRITKCVCLGLGSLDSDIPYRDCHSGYQLALLESLMEVFGWKSSSVDGTVQKLGGVELYAQDPVFNEIDKRILTEIVGFNIVETPLGFERIDSLTFVYAPHLSNTLYARALTKRPMLVFGNILELYTETTLKSETPEIFADHNSKHNQYNYPFTGPGNFKKFGMKEEYAAFSDQAFYYRSHSGENCLLED
ncbi:hypothetical protein BDZ91DRAFT_708613 [Kalaharituber pfeilii]|nr:hypothetical protein BDZ91DRAFT_708613 [Kalaharituber pfeilii]